MDIAGNNPLKRKFKPFLALRKWFKRRRFQYLEEVTTQDDLDKEQLVASEDESDGSSNQGSAENSTEKPMVTPLALYFNAHSPQPQSAYPLQKSRTADSFQGSIESMDSVVDSHWDPDDISSLKTEKHKNDAFLMEHLSFLSVSTQPQEVELMYDN